MRLFYFILLLCLFIFSHSLHAEDVNSDDLWSALRQQFTLPHYENNPLVQMHIRWFYRHPHYLYRSMQRAKPWLYFITEEAKKRHLPAELVLLPIIESAYNPLAKNNISGATGLWQMKMGTAADYGVHRNGWYDGRRDVIRSTKAALDHLSWLNDFFAGNWLLSIAAYDTGQGNVLSAIRHNIHNHEKIDFWSLHLAKETKNYVPRLLALAAIIEHPEDYPIPFPKIPNAPYLGTVNTETQFDLNEVATMANMSLKTLKQLNPGYTVLATNPSSGPFRLILPIENIKLFSTHFVHLQENTPESMYFSTNHNITAYKLQAGDTLYMIRTGDNLEKIATQFKLTASDILASNQSIQHNPLPGQIWIIPTHIKKQNTYPSKEGIMYVVKNHETLAQIAARFHLSPAEIRLTNLMSNDHVMDGDQILIPLRA